MRPFDDAFDLRRAAYAPLQYPVHVFFYWLAYFLGFVAEGSDRPPMLEVLLSCWVYLVPFVGLVVLLVWLLVRRSPKGHSQNREEGEP